MINAENIRQWTEKSGGKPLTSLEGGEDLRTRYVAFLVLRHPELLKRYLESQPRGPYETEQLMLSALDETPRSRLGGTLPEGRQWELLAEWIRWDEDAYELINQLRPE